MFSECANTRTRVTMFPGCNRIATFLSAYYCQIIRMYEALFYVFFCIKKFMKIKKRWKLSWGMKRIACQLIDIECPRLSFELMDVPCLCFFCC